jgi:hypothetical protein
LRGPLTCNFSPPTNAPRGTGKRSRLVLERVGRGQRTCCCLAARKGPGFSRTLFALVLSFLLFTCVSGCRGFCHSAPFWVSARCRYTAPNLPPIPNPRMPGSAKPAKLSLAEPQRWNQPTTLKLAPGLESFNDGSQIGGSTRQGFQICGHLVTAVLLLNVCDCRCTICLASRYSAYYLLASLSLFPPCMSSASPIYNNLCPSKSHLLPSYRRRMASPFDRRLTPLKAPLQRPNIRGTGHSPEYHFTKPNGRVGRHCIFRPCHRQPDRPSLQVHRDPERFITRPLIRPRSSPQRPLRHLGACLCSRLRCPPGQPSCHQLQPHRPRSLVQHRLY